MVYAWLDRVFSRHREPWVVLELLGSWAVSAISWMVLCLICRVNRQIRFKVEGRLVPIVDLADTIFLYMFLPMQVRRRHLSRLLSRHHRLINVFPYGASEASSLIL